MRPNRLFHLDGAELLSPAVDGVLQSARGIDVAVGVLSCEVPGLQPAVGDVLACVHPELADGIWLDVGSGVGVQNPYLHTGQRPANGPNAFGVTMVLRQQRGVCAKCLSLTEDVGKAHMRERG